MATNYGGMFPFDPAAQLEAQDISRRRALADMLTAGALKPIDPMQNSGKYITPISPVQGLAQLGQALLASHSNDVVRDEEKALGQRSQQQMLDTIFGPQKLVAPPPSPPISSDMPQSGGMAAADSPLATPQLTSGLSQPFMQRQGGILPPGVDPRVALAAAMSGKLPDILVDTFKSQLPTDAIKTADQLGISRPQQKQFAVSKANVEGTLKAGPGDIVTLPGGLPTQYPDSSGISMNMTPSGWVMSEVPGVANRRAAIAAEQTGATEAAKDPYAPFVKIQLQNGQEVLMTPAQARAMMGGQPPSPQRPQPAPMQPPAQVSRPSAAAPRMPGNVGMPPASTPDAGIVSSSAILGYKPIVPGARPPSAPQQVAGGGLVTGQTTEQKTLEEVDKDKRKRGAGLGQDFIVDRVTKSFDAAQKAADAIPALHDIGSLLDKGVYAAKGPFSGSTVELVAKTLGADPAKVANTADLKAVTITQLLSMASQLPGTLSDKDMATLKSGQASPDSMSEQTMRQIVARAEEGLRRVGDQHKRTLTRVDKADLTNAFGNFNFDVTFPPPRTSAPAKPAAPTGPLPAPQQSVDSFNGFTIRRIR